jgi:predicted DNA-binding transcriptional regulator YafY
LEFEEILSSIQTDIQLRIHPSILDRILEYCSFDRISPEGDGFLVRFPFVENDYYYDMLLGFGTRCECLGPVKVRNEIRRRINRLVDIYE